ncbi:MAG TPA: glucose 1-dehydrogenase [Bryobacteraceae bacterium]|nr:glucose 1-dehydrogenase [Bryobacteraceae bacterium]
MSPLTNRVAVITGASKGIGAGIAKAIATAGAAVAVNYAGSKEAAERVVNDIVANGGRAIAVQGSVSNAADMRRLFAETKSTFGAVDILVNNAGIGEFAPVEAVSEEQYRRLFDTNVLGVMLAVQEALGHFGPNGGSIINISSVASVSPTPASGIYAATKAAVNTLTTVLAMELGARKIRVNAIAPGPVDTDGTRGVGLIGSELERQLIAQTPLGRLGQPEDIGRIAVFLASDDAQWVSGAWIRASGGLQ